MELKKQKLIPSEIKEYKVAGNSILSSNKVSLADLEFLTAELSLLLDSGVRIDRGIDIIRRTKAKPALAKMLSEMSQGLKKGKSLSDVAKEHDNVFDPLY